MVRLALLQRTVDEDAVPVRVGHDTVASGIVRSDDFRRSEGDSEALSGEKQRVQRRWGETGAKE